MTQSHDPRRHAPATARNRAPILAVLQRVLPRAGWVLEVASGTGEHAAFLAPRLVPLVWQPSDGDPDELPGIAAHAADCGADNIRPPVHLDVRDPGWPDRFLAQPPAAIVNINMIHIAPWAAAEGLFAGTGRLLRAGGLLYLYGPFKLGGRHTAPSNESFDTSLRMRDPSWGVRDLDDATALAGRHDLVFEERVEMPANNQSVIFRRK